MISTPSIAGTDALPGATATTPVSKEYGAMDRQALAIEDGVEKSRSDAGALAGDVHTTEPDTPLVARSPFVPRIGQTQFSYGLASYGTNDQILTTSSSSSTETRDLTGATEVARTGGTSSWSNLPYGSYTDQMYASAGGVVPGGKTQYIRYDVPAPSTALAALPDSLTFTMVAKNMLLADTETRSTDDYVALGTAAGPVSVNAGKNNALATTDQQYSYTIATSGIADCLTKLNAGDLRLFIGFAATPATGVYYIPANWTAYNSPWKLGAVDPGPFGSSVDVLFRLTYTGPGPGPTSVVATIHCSGTVGTPINGPDTYTINNGQGAVATLYSGNPPLLLPYTGNARTYVLPVVNKVASGIITVTRTGEKGSAWSDFSGPYMGGSISVTDPGSGMVQVDSVSVQYTITSSGGSTGDAGTVGTTPYRRIQGDNLFVRSNHRFRGVREAKKFQLAMQRVAGQVLRNREALLTPETALAAAEDAVYPLDADIAKAQHVLEQTRFYEWVRMKKLDTRWF